MRSMLVFLLLLFAGPVSAAGWDTYANARFGYVVDVPPQFVGGPEAENGDGRLYRSRDGTQLLRVYGGNLLGAEFEAAVALAIDTTRAAGWAISYQRVTPSWASYSGIRNGQILYTRSIALCGGSQFASFEIEYPERDLAAMERTVDRLVQSLRASGGAAC